VTFSSVTNKAKKHSGKQKRSNRANTIHPRTPITFFRIGGLEVPQKVQRN
jgi:hypothetical protein